MVNHDWRISNTLWWINMNYDHDELWWWWVLHRKHMGSEVVSSSIGLEIISFDIQGYDFRTPPLPDSHWLFNICLGHHKPRSNMIEGFWRIIINIDELWWWWWWWWWVHARKYKGSEMVSSSKGLDVPSFHIAGYDFWTWFLISHHKPWWTMTEGSAAHCDELIWTIYIYIYIYCFVMLWSVSSSIAIGLKPMATNNSIQQHGFQAEVLKSY